MGVLPGLDQLKEVYGLSEETYDLIKDRLFVNPSALTRININSADYKELIRIPYFEKYEVDSYSQVQGVKGQDSWNYSDLVENKLITKEKADKIAPYLKFENQCLMYEIHQYYSEKNYCFNCPITDRIILYDKIFICDLFKKG